MKKSITLAVVGGDARFAHLARLFRADGHEVSVYALDRQSFDDRIHKLRGPKPDFTAHQAIILPMPAMQDELYLNAPLSNAPHAMNILLDAIPSGTTVLCGAAPPTLCQHAQTNGLPLIDYLHAEELAIRNAVPTAEGAIQIALEELPITLHNAHALVIGYGRVGAVLADRLACMGAQVTASARSATDFARILTAGLHTLDTRNLAGHLHQFDVIFNTVPAQILGAAELADIRQDCCIIDLASKPGGVDHAQAQLLARKLIWALSLPGKVAPLSAAQIIRDTIYHILTEEELL